MSEEEKNEWEDQVLPANIARTQTAISARRHRDKDIEEALGAIRCAIANGFQSVVFEMDIRVHVSGMYNFMEYMRNKGYRVEYQDGKIYFEWSVRPANKIIWN
jgi:hypothetical protein